MKKVAQYGIRPLCTQTRHRRHAVSSISCKATSASRIPDPMPDQIVCAGVLVVQPNKDCPLLSGGQTGMCRRLRCWGTSLTLCSPCGARGRCRWRPWHARAHRSAYCAQRSRQCPTLGSGSRLCPAVRAVCLGQNGVNVLVPSICSPDLAYFSHKKREKST